MHRRSFVTLTFVLLIFTCSETAFSKIRVFEASLGAEGLKQVNKRFTPELYLFGLHGELKLRSIENEDTLVNQVIDVVENGVTFYQELSEEELEIRFAEFKAKGVQSFKSWLNKNNVPRNQQGKQIDAYKKELDEAIRLPVLTEVEIAYHIKTSDISAEALAMLANDDDSYLLITYSADWCTPCHERSRELLNYFKSEEKNIDVNWVKLSR